MSAETPAIKKRGPPKGVRIGGRQKGTKNKSTIQRELQGAQAVAAAHGVGRELASAVLERLMGDLERYKELAEGAASLHRPPSPSDLEKAAKSGVALANGDWGLFGEWFDRVVSTTRDAAMCAKELAKYQQPQIKAVEAPTPPPAVNAIPGERPKRFTLTIFEGGQPLGEAEVELKGRTG